MRPICNANCGTRTSKLSKSSQTSYLALAIQSMGLKTTPTSSKSLSTSSAILSSTFYILTFSLQIADNARNARSEDVHKAHTRGVRYILRGDFETASFDPPINPYGD